MKVLKFGGTSVGSAQNILSVKQIVESVDTDVIVVVSALGGITDKLILCSQLASSGNKSYEAEFSMIVARHMDMIDDLLQDKQKREELKLKAMELLNELGDIYKGIFLIKDLSSKTSDTIVSYGERLSSLIVSHIIQGARLYDSRDFIKTQQEFGKHAVDLPLTLELIKKAFAPLPPVSVIPGFIASDRDKGDTTNLGRGGSDHTAALIAAALKASVLEIWTDVDGFMTADPRVINSAYLIDHMTFSEALELCNFGAKVIHPPTIYPAYHEDIPIRILNTLNPGSTGTLITKTNEKQRNKAIIKGISSINDTCLITIQGLGMVGVIGVNYRIFKSLAKNGISVFMVSQTSSENNTTLAIKYDDVDNAVRALNQEFAMELERGEISDLVIEKDLSTIAIVGENMKHMPGIAGKLFGTLGREGISVVASAQGASEMNISLAIKKHDLKKALNSLHEAFFLSEYRVLNLFISGVGTVGLKLIEQIRDQHQTLMQTNKLKIRVVGIANSTRCLFDRDGINLENSIEQLTENGTPCTTRQLCSQILELNMPNSIFVDCTASPEIAMLYQKLLNNNISIVAANKIAASSEYETYKTLKDNARLRGIKFLFETNVGAGLPIINTMNALINSGDKILRLEAVLSGTLNFIFNTLGKDIPLSEAIRQAMELGFSEPDPRTDLSGQDVVRKLVILAREAGHQVEIDDVKNAQIIPERILNGTLDDFWSRLKQYDAEFEQKRSQLESEGKRLRFVAIMNNGTCETELRAVDSSHPFYDLEGSNNTILISTERYKEHPMMIKGYGAGDGVTAAGVFADIISIANI